jgi:hypothetical protein
VTSRDLVTTTDSGYVRTLKVGVAIFSALRYVQILF